jgi:hypothetical protein
VAYRIVTDPRVRAQIRALPSDALPLIAEALSVLELTPWNGRPYNAADPDGWMRHLDLADDRVHHLPCAWRPGPGRRAERDLVRMNSGMQAEPAFESAPQPNPYPNDRKRPSTRTLTHRLHSPFPQLATG